MAKRFFSAFLIAVVCLFVFACSMEGSLYVTSSPSGAKVYLDSAEQGVTPILIDKLSPRSYSLEVELEDATSYKDTITIVAGKTTNKHVDLRAKDVNVVLTADQTNPVSGSVTLTASVDLVDRGKAKKSVTKVDFYLDGAATPFATDTSAPFTTTWDTTTIADGSHNITARASSTLGEAAGSISLQVKNITTGSLYITSAPSGAKIIIDNIDTTQLTPATVSSLAQGTHTLQLELEDATSYSGTFTIVAGQTTNKHIDLRAKGVNVVLTADQTSPVSGSVKLTASVDLVDRGKAKKSVTKVDFYLDGAATPFATDTSAPFTTTWDTTASSNGSHMIAAKAFSTIEHGESSIMLEVSNKTRAKWNFLVYMDADNSLYQYALKDLNEMEKIGSTSDVNIIVLYDGNGNFDSKILYINKDSNTAAVTSPIIKDLGEVQMDDPNTLLDFLTYCAENYPADHTVLTLWDHGGATYPRNVINPSRMSKKNVAVKAPSKNLSSRGICWDDTTGDDMWACLTTDEVKNALYQARTVTGSKIDVLNMDACIMQLLEVAYEFKNEANYLTGSEDYVPADGNDYAALLGHLVATPTLSALSLANYIVNDFYAYYSSTSNDTTYSALDLGGGLTSYMTAFKSLATALLNTSSLNEVLIAWGSSSYWSYISYELTDIYSFCENLLAYSTDSTVRNAAQSLINATSSLIINHKETGYNYNWGTGLMITMPYSTDWFYYNGYYNNEDQYLLLDLAIDTNWDEFLDAFTVYNGAPAIGRTDTMNVSVTWPNGDMDLYVHEPDGYYYAASSYYSSYNGTFGSDCLDGGTESYVLNKAHEVGTYAPGIYDYNYTGAATISFTLNGSTSTQTISIAPGDYYEIGVYSLKGKIEIRVAKVGTPSAVQQAKKHGKK